MRQTKKLIDIHQKAIEDFDKIQSCIADVRDKCVDDRRFYSIEGAQWEGSLEQQFENKPKLEVNKVHLSVIRIINEYRKNRITVDFISKDGTKDDTMDDVCNGLYRAVEQDSSAEEAYDNAFEEAIGGGFGAFRLCTIYEDEYDEENEKQKIIIEPIYDADSSVYFDLDAKRYDKSDAKHCFLLTSYTYDAFIDEWGEDPSTWTKEIRSTSNFDWCTPNVVYVAEYYKIEETKETIYIYTTIDGAEEKYKDSDFENDEQLEERLQSIGTTFDRERKIKVRRVRKYIMSGNKILEDCGYIAGKNIPIIPVYAKRWFIDNKEQCMGHVRLAKDVQRIKNMQMSKLAEISALSTVEKPILTPEQVSGHQANWKDDNIKNYPYLLINPMTDINGNTMPAGPLAYTKVPNIPPAMAALLQLTDADIKELLGNHTESEQIRPNMSGKAYELLFNRLDVQSYIYMSNMAKSIKRSGEIFLSMVPDIYVEDGRKMKIVDFQNEIDSITLMEPYLDEKTSKVKYKNDLSNLKLDVAVEVGPSSSSKRDATVRSITEMLQLTQDPETIQVLTSMALMNMEGEGIQEVNEYFRQKLIRLGVIKPTKSEIEQMQAELENQQPDANTVYLKAAAEAEAAKAERQRAETVYTISKAEKTQAEIEETKAKTIETLSQVSENQQKIAEQAFQKTGEILNQQQLPNV